MIVRQLTLNNFRNHADLRLTFSPNVTILTGHNGAGKTNILEALAVITRGRSFRTHRDEVLCMHGNSHYYLKAAVETQGTHTIEHSWHNRVTRVAVDQKEIQTRREFIGKYPATLLLPSDTELISGEPKLRRDFFNMLISNTDAQFLATLIHYHRILKSRNVCLAVHSPDYALYDEQLAADAIAIAAAHRQWAQRTTDAMNALYEALFNIPGSYHIEYSGMPFSDTGAFCAALAKNHDRESKMKTTLIGPQRADFQLSIAATDARVCASQGERRLASVLMKLAEHRLIIDQRGETPLLLIDDALLELDMKRRAAVLMYVQHTGQTCITVTEPEKVTSFIAGAVIDIAEIKNK